MDLLRCERLDRYISHPNSYSSVVGVNIEACQEDCIDYCAWCRHLRAGLCHAQEHFRPRGTFHRSGTPLIIVRICSLSKTELGSRQWCPTCRHMGYSRNLRRGRHHKPSHDLPSHQNISQASLAQCLTIIQEHKKGVQDTERLPNHWGRPWGFLATDWSSKRKPCCIQRHFYRKRGTHNERR